MVGACSQHPPALPGADHRVCAHRGAASESQPASAGSAEHIPLALGADFDIKCRFLSLIFNKLKGDNKQKEKCP